MSEYKRIERDGVKYYGQHMMASLAGCNNNLLETIKIAEYFKELVQAIDMVAYGDPLIARFGSGIEEGISGVQLIETSAITIHTNDMALDLYLDVFSCKEYDNQIVLDITHKYFSPREVSYEVVLRK